MKHKVGMVLPGLVVAGILFVSMACTAATATPTTAPATATPTRPAVTTTTVAPTTTTAAPTATAVPGVTTTAAAPTATPTRPATTVTTAPVATVAPTAVATPTPSVTVKRGGIYNKATTTKPAQFNIDFITSGPAGTSTNSLLYSTLLTRELDGKLVGELANRWEYTDSGTTLVIKLRSDARFNDGTSMTAVDVHWSILKWLGLITGHGASVRMSSINQYMATGTAADVVIVDNLTVSIKLKFAAPVLESYLTIAHAGITKKDTTVAQLQQKPYGTGPWDFASEVSGSSFDLKPNPFYFKVGADGKPLPYMAGVRSYIITDQTAGWSALLTQKLHIFSSDAGTPPDMVEPLKRLDAQGLKLENGTPGSQDLLVYNFNRKDLPTADVRVRKAIDLAFSRQDYIAAVWVGLMVPGMLFPIDSGYYWSTPAATYMALPGQRADKTADLAAAKQLMTDAGHPNGFTIQMDTSDRFVKQAEYQCLELAKLKITCKIAPYPDATWDDHVAINKACNLCSDSFAHLNTGDPDEPLFRHFVPGGPRNNGSYESADVIAAIQQQSRELDPVKRKAMVLDIENKIYQRDFAWSPIGFKIGTSARWNYVIGNKSSDVYAGIPNRLDKVWINK